MNLSMTNDNRWKMNFNSKNDLLHKYYTNLWLKLVEYFSLIQTLWWSPEFV